MTRAFLSGPDSHEPNSRTMMIRAMRWKHGIEYHDKIIISVMACEKITRDCRSPIEKHIARALLNRQPDYCFTGHETRRSHYFFFMRVINSNVVQVISAIRTDKIESDKQTLLSQ